MSMAITKIEEQIEKKRAELDALKTRLNSARTKQRATERKWKEDAKLEFGCIIERELAGGNWRVIDPNALEQFCQEFKQSFVCTDDISAEGANERLRLFKQSRRKTKACASQASENKTAGESVVENTDSADADGVISTDNADTEQAAMQF